MEDKTYKYTGITKDGYIIQSDVLEHFKLEELTQFSITEEMTEAEIRKQFGTDYELPSDFKAITKFEIKPKK